LHAKAVFFRGVNDVDVYVEDTAPGTKKLYSTLLSRAFGGTVSIEKVFPIGSRDDVLDACRADAGGTGRSRVYVIDGDFDLIDANADPLEKGLFILPRYCVENFLSCPVSIAAIVDEDDIHRSAETIKEELSFEEWIARNEPIALRLYSAFAAARGLAVGMALVSSRISRFVMNQMGDISPTKVEAYIDEIRNSVDEARLEEFEQKFEAFQVRCAQVEGGMIRVASGKDFVLPLMLLRARSVARIDSRNRVIAQRLALRVPVEEFVSILDHVRSD
jgi:hypothetical protein